MSIKSTIIKNIMQLQGDVVATVGILPESLQNRIVKILSVQKGMGNADAHMKIILGAQRLIGARLITEDYKKSRRAFLAYTRNTQGKPIHMHVEDITLDNPHSHDKLKLRHYHPTTQAASSDCSKASVLLFFHGGGFVIGSLDTHDEFCRYFAHYTGMDVLSVDYRLAPEHPAPAAIEDAQVALEWLYQHAHELGVDPECIYVGGDSAGANISTVLSQQTKIQAHAPKAQLLIYPVTDNGRHYHSYDQYGTGFPLSLQDKSTFDFHYIHSGKLKPTSPLVSPIRGELAGVCPAFVVTSELDLLVDEGEAYAHKLRQSDVRVASKRVYGQPHGFINMINIHKGAKLETIGLCREFKSFVQAL